jgi:multimeric flavodoxin WrbA
MKLVIFNGSPKKESSNTARIVKPFIQGFLEREINSCEVVYIYNQSLHEMRKKFFMSEYVLLVLPMYFSSMPSRVKEFIEELEGADRGGFCQHLGFIVQYGFPEAIHAEALEKYFGNLSKRLNSLYLGTIIVGGSDGIDREAGFFIPKFFKGMKEMGGYFGQNGMFNDNNLTTFSLVKERGIIFNTTFDLIIKKAVATYVNKKHWDVLMRESFQYAKRRTAQKILF